MAGEVIGLSREATAIVLLSEHYFILYKWRYSCLYLCSQTSTIVSFGQRNFFSRRELVTAESHSWSKCREWMTVECLAINGTSSISPHPTPKTQQYHRKGLGGTWRPVEEVWRLFSGVPITLLSSCDYVYKNCTKIGSSTSCHIEGRGSWGSYGCWERKKMFSSGITNGRGPMVL